MKPITKVLFGIVAICGLLQSIGFGLLLWPNREFTRFYVQQAGWLRPVMIGLTGLVIVALPSCCLSLSSAAPPPML